MKIYFRSYIDYKFLNSVFNGAVTGSVFTVYALLEPSIFSIGGIIVAVGMFMVAKLYSRLMKLRLFFEVSLFTELLVLCTLVVFLFIPKSYFVAISYFWLYQAVFIFGTYLIRVESYFLNKIAMLSIIDRVKQKGYLVGLFGSLIFYEIIKFFGVKEAWEQVWLLYTTMFILQTAVTWFLFKAFRN